MAAEVSDGMGVQLFSARARKQAKAPRVIVVAAPQVRCPSGLDPSRVWRARETEALRGACG
jgi:hypothetical protein